MWIIDEKAGRGGKDSNSGYLFALYNSAPVRNYDVEISVSDLIENTGCDALSIYILLLQLPHILTACQAWLISRRGLKSRHDLRVGKQSKS